jgi:hypothetical protein
MLSERYAWTDYNVDTSQPIAVTNKQLPDLALERVSDNRLLEQAGAGRDPEAGWLPVVYAIARFH